MTSVAILGAAVLSALVPNGGFEQGLDGWEVRGEKKVWCLGAGAGRPPKPSTPPTQALVWERGESDPKGAWIGTEVPVEPGRIYRITVWATVDRLSGNKRNPGFSVGIGTKVRYSKWCCSTRLRFDRTEEVDLDGWRRLTNVTPPIPGDADRMVIALQVDGDAVGRVRFDDVTLEPIGERVIENFCCMAPGRAASSGPVLFSASLCYDVTRYPPAAVRAKLKWNSGERTMKLVGADAVELDVDAAEFQMGPNEVTLSLETVDGRTIAKEAIDFTRTAPDPEKRRTKFDARGRLLVDGRPVFPLGVYWHYCNNGDEEAYDLLAKTPFNFVVSYDKDLKDTAELDRFHKRGFGVFSSLAHCYPWISYRPAGVKDEASAVRHVERVVKMIRNHPAHWGWYLVDEPTMDKIPSVLAQYRRVKALDPDHVCGTMTWTPNDQRMLAQCGEFVGVDTYPIGCLGATEEQKKFPDLAEITRECAIAREQVRGRRPLWQAPQAFNWQGDFPKVKYPWMRMPTREEFVSQAWQSIASHADGFCWFDFRSIYADWKKGDHAPFENLCAALEEVRRLSPVLLSDEAPPALKGMDATLTARSFQYEGCAYVVACNLTWKRRTATLELSGEWSDPVTEVGAAATLDGGHRLALDLPPIGVSVLRLQPVRK